MRTSVRLLSLAATAAFVTACSDSSAPSSSTTLSTEQRVALSTALGNLNDGGLGIASAASNVVMLASTTGSLDAGTAAAGAAIDASVHGVRATSYSGAIGYQVISDNPVYATTAVVGWDGLRIQAKTVDELVFAMVQTNTVTPVGTGSYPLVPPQGTFPLGIGIYANQVNASTYVATTGALTLTSTSFSGALLDCSEPAFTCSYRLGSMSGSFYFTSGRYRGDGPTAYTQPTVSFTNLPAVQVYLTLN